MSYKLPFLLTYAYLTDKNKWPFVIDLCKRSRVLFDSGAFTMFWQRVRKAAKKSATLNVYLDGYMEFCHEVCKPYSWGYIALDEICRPDESMANFEKMQAANLNPIPVLVEGMDYTYIPKLLDYCDDWLCVASGSNSASTNTPALYAGVYQKSGKRAKIHGLGYGKWPDMLSVSLTTMDSSTWLSGTKFGQVQTFGWDTGFSRWIIRDKKRGIPGQAMQRLKEMEVPYTDLINDDSYRVSKLRPNIPFASSIQCYIRLSIYMEKVAKKLYFMQFQAFFASVQREHALASLTAMDWKTVTIHYPTYKEALKKLNGIDKNILRDYVKEHLLFELERMACAQSVGMWEKVEVIGPNGF